MPPPASGAAASAWGIEDLIAEGIWPASGTSKASASPTRTFTDAGAPHLAKLTKLKGLELGTSRATPQALVHIAMLPLEYLQLGEGFDSPESILFIKDLASLRRLTFTNVQKWRTHQHDKSR